MGIFTDESGTTVSNGQDALAAQRLQVLQAAKLDRALAARDREAERQEREYDASRLHRGRPSKNSIGGVVEHMAHTLSVCKPILEPLTASGKLNVGMVQELATQNINALVSLVKRVATALETAETTMQSIKVPFLAGRVQLEVEEALALNRKNGLPACTQSPTVSRILRTREIASSYDLSQLDGSKTAAVLLRFETVGVLKELCERVEREKPSATDLVKEAIAAKQAEEAKIR